MKLTEKALVSRNHGNISRRRTDRPVLDDEHSLGERAGSPMSLVAF